MWTGPLVVALASLLAPAPQPPPAGQAGPPPAENAPGGLLAGPKVPHVDEQAGPRGPRGPAAPGAGGMGGRRREPAVNPRQWFAILQKIELAPAQREAAEQARRELRQATESFNDAHGSRLRELSAKASATRPPGEDLSEEERREFRELRDLRPRPDEYMMRIWRLLDENQQEEMRRLLAAAAKDRRTRDRRAPGSPGDPGDEAGPMGPGDRPPPVGEPGLDPMARRRMDFLRRRQGAPPIREPAPPPPPEVPGPSATPTA